MPEAAPHPLALPVTVAAVQGRDVESASGCLLPTEGRGMFGFLILLQSPQVHGNRGEISGRLDETEAPAEACVPPTQTEARSVSGSALPCACAARPAVASGSLLAAPRSLGAASVPLGAVGR